MGLFPQLFTWVGGAHGGKDWGWGLRLVAGHGPPSALGRRMDHRCQFLLMGRPGRGFWMDLLPLISGWFPPLSGFFLCVCVFKNCLHSLYFSLRALGWTLNERSEFWPFWHQCVGSFLLWVLESLLILWSKKAHLASWLHKQFLSLGGPRTVWGASASTLAFLTLGAFGGYLLSVR